MFPDAVILKNDSSYMQGVPDLLILQGDRWAMLEVKRKKPTSERDWEPNQEWFLEYLDRMSYAACVYPENEEVVLRDLQQLFAPRRKARNSQR